MFSFRYIYLPGVHPVILSFMGGNSTKATSGINGAGTNTQRAEGIPDTAEIFFNDTKKSVCSPLIGIPQASLTVPHSSGPRPCS